MEISTEKQADGRWIFPKELEGIYSNDQLKYFIDEAETRVRESVSSLVNIRDRFYSLINISLVIIGALITVIVAVQNLNSFLLILLSALLIFFCVISAILFKMVKPYDKYGPGFKPSDLIGEKMLHWTMYYHGDSSERSILYSVLEGKQGSIDRNNSEYTKQLKNLGRIITSIRIALYVASAVLVISIICSWC